MKQKITINGVEQEIIIPDNATPEQVTDLVNELNTTSQVNKPAIKAPEIPIKKSNIVEPNPFKVVGGGVSDWAKGLGKSGEEVVEAHKQPINYGLGTLHALGKDAALVSNVLATPLTLPAAMASRAFPRASEAVKGGIQSTLGAVGKGVGNLKLSSIEAGPEAYESSPTLGQMASRVPVPVKTAVGDVMNLASVVPVGKGASLALKAEKMMAKPVVEATGKLVGPTVERVGKRMEERGIEKIPQIIKPKASLLERVEGATPEDKIKNFSKTIADYNLQNKIKNPEQLRKAADDLATKHVENADTELDLFSSGLLGSKKINPVNEINTRLSDVSKYADAGKFPEYRAAFKKIKKDMEELKYNEDMPLSSIKEVKAFLNRRSDVYKHAVGPNMLDPVIKDVKKRMSMALNDAAVDIAPEAKKFRYENDQAKKLINIKKIASDEEYKDLIKKPGFKAFLATAGLGGAVAPSAMFAQGALTGNIPSAALWGLGGAVLGAGALGAKRALTSPSVTIPTGKGIKNLGMLMQGKNISKSPGKAVQSFEREYPDVSGKSSFSIKKVPGRENTFEFGFAENEAIREAANIAKSGRAEDLLKAEKALKTRFPKSKIDEAMSLLKLRMRKNKGAK